MRENWLYKNLIRDITQKILSFNEEHKNKDIQWETANIYFQNTNKAKKEHLEEVKYPDEVLLEILYEARK